MQESQSKSQKNGKVDGKGQTPCASCGDLATSAQAQMMPAYALGQNITAVPLFGSTVQAKLAVGQPDDPYEKEADGVAAYVLSGAAAAARPTISSLTPSALAQSKPDEKKEAAPQNVQPVTEEKEHDKTVPRQQTEEQKPQDLTVQRQTEEEEKREPIQAQLVARSAVVAESEEEVAQKRTADKEDKETEPVERDPDDEEGQPVQLEAEEKRPDDVTGHPSEEEEEPLQMQATPRDRERRNGEAAERAITQRNGGEPMATGVRSKLEQHTGADLSDVRVHTGAEAGAASSSLGARAFTNRNHIWLAQGERADNLGLMAHETTHVLQQGGAGRPAADGEGAGGGPEVQLLPRAEQPVDAPSATTGDPSSFVSTTTGSASTPVGSSTLSSNQQSPLTLTTGGTTDQSSTSTTVSSGTDAATATKAAFSNAASNIPVSTTATTSTVPSQSVNVPGTPTPGSSVDVTQGGGTSLDATTTSNTSVSVGNTPVGAADTSAVTTNADTQTLTPSATVSDGGTMPGVTGGQTTAEFQHFLDEALAKRAALLNSPDEKKASIRATGEAQKLNLRLSIEAEVSRIEGVYDQSIQQIRSAMQNARIEVESQRAAKIQLAQQTAETELANLERVVGEKQAAVRRAGEAKATAAERVGEEQAQRAISGCRLKASEAGAIGTRKAQQYRTYNRAARIARVAQEMATEAAQSILSAGAEMASVARRDAGELATKFRREAEEAAVKFAESLGPGMTKIQEERDQTIAGLNQMGTEPLANLESSGNNLIAQLETGRQGAGQQIRQLLQGTTTQIDQSVRTVCDSVDQQTQQAVSDLDVFISEMQTRFGSARGETAARHLDGALAELTATVTEFDGQMTGFVNTTSQAIEQSSIQTIQQAQTQVDQLSGPVQQTGADFEINAARVSGEVTQSMQEPTTTGVNEMHRAVTDVEGELQNGVDESERNWDGELSQGTNEITDKITQGLAKQDEIVGELPGKIDEKAEEIEDESWLSRALSFVGGLIVGFLEAAWEVIKALLIIALIIIAVIVVIGLIILLVGGIAALLEVILAVAAFVAAVAAALAVVLKVVAVLLIIGFVLLGAYYIYLSITRDDLSDYERGRLAGRGVFEIVLSVFGGRIFAKLGKWARGLAGGGEATADAARLARLQQLVGDEAQLERLLGNVGGDAAQLERLLATSGNNAAQLERLLGLSAGDAGQLERLLARTENAAQLERLLGRADPAQLERLLGQTTDAAQLERLLGATGSDAAQLERLLGRTTDAAQLERLLGATGNDAARLDRLLAKTSDTAQLERLLGAAGNDAAQLERLLTITDDAAQAERLLGRVNNAAELEGLINRAGFGAPPSPDVTRLERALDQLGSGNHPIAAIEAKLDELIALDSKILEGRTVAPPTPGVPPTGAAREIIGAHSPRILTRPDFNIMSQVTNADGTISVKFTKQVSPGPPPVMSSPKRSTLAPASWSDADILRTGDQVANTPAIQTRIRDGATLHRDVVNGVQWEVIKDASGRVTSSYPTGGNPTVNF